MKHIQHIQRIVKELEDKLTGIDGDLSRARTKLASGDGDGLKVAGLQEQRNATAAALDTARAELQALETRANSREYKAAMKRAESLQAEIKRAAQELTKDIAALGDKAVAALVKQDEINRIYAEYKTVIPENDTPSTAAARYCAGIRNLVHNEQERMKRVDGLRRVGLS